MQPDKRRDILAAAYDAFRRHGFRRVTMGDLAREAGLSRPALYLIFPNKEAIFREVLTTFVEQLTEEARAGLEERTTVADRLGFVFEVWTVRPFELVREAPDARELTDCSHDFAGDVVAGARHTFESQIADVLEPGTDALARRGTTPAETARVLAFAAQGIKENASDVHELRTLVGGLVRVAIAALGEP